MTAPMRAPTSKHQNAEEVVEPLDTELLTAPIPDDGDKILTGKDILRKLHAEKRELEKGELFQPAYAIMAGIDTNGLADKLAISMRTKQTCNQQELRLIATEIGNRLLQYIDSYGSHYNAELRNQAIALVKKGSLDRGENKVDRELSSHQIISRMNFAQSFHANFDRIAIKPDEVVPILEFFAEKPDDLKPCKATQQRRGIPR